MSDPVPSPRRQLLLAMGKTLQLISLTNGYLTNAGAGWTLEPKPGDQDTQAVLTAVIEKQQRPESPSKAGTHRLTTVSVIAKVPADTEGYQQALDDLVTDIETAMDNREVARNFPDGIQVPVYVGMEPLMPEKASAGWVGVLITYQSHIPKK
ncbi:hypothetical protein [Stenotrophomonas lactitubi]|uniref:hypothetical protein n=1 Tax=Stenotrophomonas lactitubi TaxID=2045214 RepID=UPI001D68BA2F|nr:hypothetical protein [Stenotrophomonas lactitubi]CAH0139267.1 hypothetical protein SRABI122_00424 [Stenotrophomonas lactitubi]CAH0154570.1 hypothetical protein SRABI66_00800 [Stenotrophomonas lactitubi]CAH0171529.1 hypothetical protein SRABI81_01224 [Stenotrophomonas lactitubi]CAH0204976.1 hypothetical protein SRABI102_01869 [Stenotrophomonas lactitubi]